MPTSNGKIDVGCPKKDRKSVEWLRGKTGLKDFALEARKRKWRNVKKVLAREAEGRWDAKLIRWTPPGKRPLGRPKKRWSDPFSKYAGRDWLNVTGTNMWDSLLHTFVIN